MGEGAEGVGGDDAEVAGTAFEGTEEGGVGGGVCVDEGAVGEDEGVGEDGVAGEAGAGGEVGEAAFVEKG